MNACTWLEVLIGGGSIVGAIVFLVVMWNEPNRQQERARARIRYARWMDGNTHDETVRQSSILQTARSPRALPSAPTRPQETITHTRSMHDHLENH